MSTIESVYEHLDAIAGRYDDAELALAECLGYEDDELLAAARDRVKGAVALAANSDLGLHEIAGLLIAASRDSFRAGVVWGREPRV